MVIAAAYNGFDEMVAALLKLGAIADAPMSNGWNALMVACAQGHSSVVSRLCEAGASADYARASNGFSALMAACSAPHAMCEHVAPARSKCRLEGQAWVHCVDARRVARPFDRGAVARAVQGVCRPCARWRHNCIDGRRIWWS